MLGDLGRVGCLRRGRCRPGIGRGCEGGFGEVQSGAGEQLHAGAVDVPADPVRELAGAAEDQGEMRVVDDGDSSRITESVCCSALRTGGPIRTPRNDVSNPKTEIRVLSDFIVATPISTSSWTNGAEAPSQMVSS